VIQTHPLAPRRLQTERAAARYRWSQGEASFELRSALARGEVAPAVSFPEGGVPLFGGG